MDRNDRVDYRFKTTNGEYGKYSPNIHTMACYFYPLNGQFTEVAAEYVMIFISNQHLGKCGMYRNHSFNTSSQ